MLDKLRSDSDAPADSGSDVPTKAGGRPDASLAVLIVGMHRSGTSALSGMLNKLGVAVPEELHPADEHNAKGYFEPTRIIDFHEALLAKLGSPSNDPLPLTYDWVNSPLGQAAAAELSDILDEEFGDNAMCLFKDPRMCRLAPVWTAALAISGRPGVAILPCRHPLEVAGSLQVKGGLSRPYALFMWLQHVVLGERFTRSMPRSFTNYDALLSDWRVVADKLERDLKIVWPRDLMRSGSQIDAFLSTELRHHQSEALKPHDALHALCLRAWDALGALQADALDKAAMAEMDAIAASLDAGVALFGSLVVSYQSDLRKTLDEGDLLRHEVAVRDKIIGESQRARAVLRQRYEEKELELGWAQDGLIERDRQIGEATGRIQRLEAQNVEAVGRALAIESSTSWKISHGLRLVLQDRPVVRRALRGAAKLGWWVSTGKLSRKLRERKVAIAEIGAAPAPPQPQPLAAPSPAAPQVRTRLSGEPLHITFLSGEADTPGHVYRIVRYAEAAAAVGCTTSIVSIDEAHARLDDFRRADVVFIWRAAWDEVNVEAALQASRENGAVVVFDVDDLIVEPDLAKPEIIDGMRSQRHATPIIIDYFARLQRTLRAADYGSAPTPFLAEFLQRYSKDYWNKLTFQLPNGFDEEVLRRSRLAARRRRQTPGDGLVRIGYATGSRTHQADFAQAAEGLALVLREHPECRLVLFRSQHGDVLDIAEFAAFDGLFDQVEWRDIVPIQDLPNEIARFDINIAPLEVGNIFCEAKSELKYFEAALVDVPTVASPTGPYKIGIRHGETGFLATTAAEWRESLKRLVQDASLRQSIAKAGLYDSLVRYGPERRAQRFLAMLDQILVGGRRGAQAFALDTAVQLAAPAAAPFVPPHETVVEYDKLGMADVTVVVPLYNYAGFVVEALESAAAQKLRGGVDLVVVDDGSTDDSLAVAKDWIAENWERFNRVALIRNRQNSGLAFTRNVGFANAETAFVLPLDADNRLLPEAAAQLLAAIRPNAAAFAYPMIRQFGSTDLIADDTELGLTPFDPGRFRSANFIDALALVRRSAWVAVGGYDHIRFGWEDYDFWCKLIERGEFGVQVPRVLAEYRIHGQSMLRSETDLRRNKLSLIETIERRHPWLSIDRSSLPPAQPEPGPSEAAAMAHDAPSDDLQTARLHPEPE